MASNKQQSAAEKNWSIAMLSTSEDPEMIEWAAKVGIDNRPVITIDGTSKMHMLNPESGSFTEGTRTWLKKSTMEQWGSDFMSYCGKEVIEQAQIRTSKSSAEIEDLINSKFEWINLKNGALNVVTGEFINRTKDNWRDFKNYYFFHNLPVQYDREAACPAFDEFLNTVIELPMDREIVWEMIGYCLYRNYRFKNVFFLLGDPDTGKTTLLNIIEALLGPENISAVSWKRLSKDRFELVKLRHKLANLAGETGDNELSDLATIKDASGNGLMSFRIMHSQVDPKAHLYSKLVQAGNSLPTYPGKRDLGYEERLIVIWFTHVFVKGKDMNTDLLKKLTTPQELSGILNKALEALARLLKRGYFEKGSYLSTMKIEENWRIDPCTAYLETYVTTTSEMDSAPNFEELYLDAVAVMRERRKAIPERHLFSLKLNAWLQDKGIVKKETKNRGTTYPGLKLIHVSSTYEP